MKVVVLANMRWLCFTPSWYRLACPSTHHVELVFVGPVAGWFLTDGEHHVPVPDRDTGAMMLAKQLNAQRAGGG